MKHLKLFELYYSDVFSKNFITFREKYNKLKNNKNLYVQFTNYKGDVLDRTAILNPSHSDPTGNYAYPLKYVIEHPSDLWYGMDAKHIRILEKTSSCNTLVLNHIHTELDCIMEAIKLKKEWKKFNITQFIYIIQKEYKYKVLPKNSGYWGRVFFQILQVDLENKNEKEEYRIRTSEEQTKLLLNGGWNAIEDISKKDSVAIINSREPEQICFLDRKSFTVKEIFNLTDNKNKGVASHFNPSDSNIPKKWAVSIFEMMDDKLVGSYYNTFYSMKGREVLIDFKKQKSYYDKKIGQKFHKANKLNDENSVKIKITTEKGNIINSFDEDEKFYDILKTLKDEWNSIKNNENIPNWSPRSNKKRLKEEEDKKNEYYIKHKEIENKKHLDKLDNWIETLYEWCNFLKIDFKLPQNKEDILKLYQKVFLPFANICNMKLNKDGIEYLEKNIRIIKNDIQDLSNDENFSMILFDMGKDYDKNVIISFLEVLLKIIKHISIKDNNFFNSNFYAKDFSISESAKILRRKNRIY
jgi:hypothetical protein